MAIWTGLDWERLSVESDILVCSIEADRSGCRGGGSGRGGGGGCDCGGGEARRLRLRQMCAQTPFLEIAVHIRRLCARSDHLDVCFRKPVVCSCSVWMCVRRRRRRGLRSPAADVPRVSAPEALDGDAHEILLAETVEVRPVI